MEYSTNYEQLLAAFYLSNGASPPVFYVRFDRNPLYTNFAHCLDCASCLTPSVLRVLNAASVAVFTSLEHAVTVEVSAKPTPNFSFSVIAVDETVASAIEHAARDAIYATTHFAGNYLGGVYPGWLPRSLTTATGVASALFFGAPVDPAPEDDDYSDDDYYELEVERIISTIRPRTPICPFLAIV